MFICEFEPICWVLIRKICAVCTKWNNRQASKIERSIWFAIKMNQTECVFVRVVGLVRSVADATIFYCAYQNLWADKNSKEVEKKVKTVPIVFFFSKWAIKIADFFESIPSFLCELLPIFVSFRCCYCLPHWFIELADITHREALAKRPLISACLSLHKLNYKTGAKMKKPRNETICFGLYRARPIRFQAIIYDGYNISGYISRWAAHRR